MNGPFTVVVADDHPVFLKGLVRELERLGLSVVASCGDGNCALRAIQRLAPHFALLDVRMPNLTGIDVCRQVIQNGCSTIPLILSTYDEPAVVREAMLAGARAFLPKDSTAEEMVKAMGRLHDDPQLVVAPEVAIPHLTRRESDVFFLVIRGLSTAQIARTLQISPDTVKDYLGSVYGKFGVRDRFELLQRAHDLGFRPPPAGGGA